MSAPHPTSFPQRLNEWLSTSKLKPKEAEACELLSVAVRRPVAARQCYRASAALLRAPHIEHVILEDWLLGAVRKKMATKSREPFLAQA